MSSLVALLLPAYIDPTAGGFLLQMLLAGTAGAAVVLRLFWRRLTDPFRKKDPAPPEE